MATAAEIGTFVEKVVSAMGLSLKAEAEEMEDGLRIRSDAEVPSLRVTLRGK